MLKMQCLCIAVVVVVAGLLPAPIVHAQNQTQANTSGFTPCQECTWNIAEFYNEQRDGDDPYWQAYRIACGLACLSEQANRTFDRVGPTPPMP